MMTYWLLWCCVVVVQVVRSSPVVVVGGSPEEDLSDYYQYHYTQPDSSSEEDLEQETPCAPSQFFHIRGRMCVPFRCPRGNSLRDYATGECLFDDDGNQLVSKSIGYRFRSVLSPRRVSQSGRGTNQASSKWYTNTKRVQFEFDDRYGIPGRSIGLFGQ